MKQYGWLKCTGKGLNGVAKAITDLDKLWMSQAGSQPRYVQVQKKDTTTPDFETAQTELEALIERMESGEMTLEAALQDFERGVKLIRQCQEALNQAEQKVAVLMQNTPDAELEPFDREN